MGKSKGRHTIADVEFFGKHFTDARAIDAHDYYASVMDCMVTWYQADSLHGTRAWRAANPDAPPPNPLGRDLVEFLLHDYRAFSRKRAREGRASVYVLCFDKPKYVPKNKSFTQVGRGQCEVPPLEWDGHSSIIGWDRPLPSMRALNKNRPARYHAIGEVCALIEEYYADDAAQHDCLLFLEGYATDNTEPILLPRSQQYYVASEFANKIGEADHMLMFYTRAFAERGKNVRTLSIDTDLLYLHLMHSAARLVVDETDRCVSRAGRFKNHVVHEFASDSVVDVNGLCDAIAARLSPRLRTPVATFAVGVSCAANDYIHNFHFVPPHHFVRALVEHSDYIGDLLTMDMPTNDSRVNLDVDAYFRLVKCAYVIAHKLGDTPSEFEWTWQCRPPCTSLEKAVLATIKTVNANTLKKLPPTNEELTARAMHMSWYAIYLSNGADCAYDQLPNCADYAYEEVWSDDAQRNIWQPMAKLVIN